jgi:hypothetical protein
VVLAAVTSLVTREIVLERNIMQLDMLQPQ